MAVRAVSWAWPFGIDNCGPVSDARFASNEAGSIGTVDIVGFGSTYVNTRTCTIVA